MRAKEQVKKGIEVWSWGGKGEGELSVGESRIKEIDLFLSKLELVNSNYNLISILYVTVQTQKTILQNSLRSTFFPHLETPQVDRISWWIKIIYLSGCETIAH